ncbi:hypothetical protein AB0284_07175 [Pseudarthrobacter phenanthrenivorans]|uniref:hypothetical protein n=1 Tax=Pseudarthrobacter phenanthrenivorans TaxID=361575 RepID=UPI00344C88EA
MKSNAPMPWPLKVLGILFLVAVIALILLGQMDRALLRAAAIGAASVAVLLGLSVLADFRGSARWLGQFAKDNASLFFKGSAPDSGVYRIIGAGFVVLGVAIGAVVLTHLPQ